MEKYLNMYGPTRDIKLNSAWQKRYLVSKIFVYLFFILGISYLGYLILFPSKHFTFDFDHPDSLKNSISNVRDVNGDIIFNASTSEMFSNAKLSLAFKKTSPSIIPSAENLRVRKSFKAFFYEESDSVFDMSGREINSLVSSGNSVFIAGNKKKYPINNTVTFESSGYDWDNIKSSQDFDLSEYEKQKLFSINSAHPDGTIFRVEEDNEYYYILNNQKYILTDEDSKNDTIKKESILVQNKSLNIEEFCEFKKESLTFLNKYSCNVDLATFSEIIGKDYEFFLKNSADNTEIKEINLELRRDINMDNLKISISNIKNKMLIYYGFDDENK